MARPKSDLIQLHIRLSESTLNRIDDYAKSLDLNRTDTIKYLLKYSIDSLRPVAPQESKALN